MGSLPASPWPGLGADYRVVELAILGSFAAIPEPLFHYRMRDPDPLEVLARKLDPGARHRGTMFGWWLRDMWRLTGRHGLDLGTRLKVQAEYLASVTAPRSSLHVELLRYNRERRRAALHDRRWRDVASLLVERCLLGRAAA